MWSKFAVPFVCACWVWKNMPMWSWQTNTDTRYVAAIQPVSGECFRSSRKAATRDSSHRTYLCVELLDARAGHAHGAETSKPFVSVEETHALNSV